MARGAKTPRGVLRGAKKALKEYGWIRGTNRATDGRLCLRGAALWAAGIEPVGQYGSLATDRLNGPFRPAYLGAMDALNAAARKRDSRLSLPDIIPAAVSYNDNDAQSVDDVLSLIDDALKLVA